MPKERTLADANEKWRRFHQALEDKVASTQNGSRENAEAPLFHYFTAGHPDLSRKAVELPEKEKLDQFLFEIEQGNWSSSIFEDEKVEDIALWCFRNAKISYEQFLTILERQQQQLDFPDRQMHLFQLLDEHGNYTDFAQQYFIPALEQALHIQGMVGNRTISEDKKEQLRSLIATLPKSEQICYMTEISFEDTQKMLPGTDLGQISSDSSGENLLGNMIRLGVAFCERYKDLDGRESSQLITASAGVENAVALTIYGVKKHIAPVHRVGNITTREIEEGVRQRFRPTAITLREGPLLKNIHDDPNPARTATTKHDRYHSNVMSRTPEAYRNAFFHMIDVTRERLSSMHAEENSHRRNPQPTLSTSEIWLFTDAEFSVTRHSLTFFKKESPASLEEKTKHFCELLDARAKIDNSSPFYNSDNKVSPFGLIVFVDMLQNSALWRERFQIDPELLTGKMGAGYNLIQRLSTCDANFLNDPIELQALKLHMAQSCGNLDNTQLAGLLQATENYCQQNGGVEVVCQLRRNIKRQGELLDTTLQTNQVILEINPLHLPQLDNIKTEFTRTQEESTQMSWRSYCALS